MIVSKVKFVLQFLGRITCKIESKGLDRSKKAAETYLLSLTFLRKIAVPYMTASFADFPFSEPNLDLLM